MCAWLRRLIAYRALSRAPAHRTCIDTEAAGRSKERDERREIKYGDYDQTTTLSNIEQSTPGGGTTIIDRLVETEKNNTIDLFSLGLRYELDNIVIMAEGQTSNLSSSWYATTSYNVNKLTPYIVYGQQFNSRDKKSGDSFLLGLRYDLDYNVSLNAEWQRFNAYNNSSGAFSSAPKDDSASLYTLMLNFVF